jgi:ribosomal protein L35
MPKLKTKSGAKKRFKVTATGKVMDQEADSSASRHPRAVQDRRRQHQEILLAVRLIATRDHGPT